MRETFTLLFALMLSVAVNAQTKIEKPNASSIEKNTELTVLSPSASRHKAPQRKIEIGEGERLMGFYTGDDLYYGLAFNSTGTYQVANWFDKEVIGNFVGGQIMRFRFALAYSATVYSAYIYAAKDGVPSDEPLAYISYGNGTTLSSGWTDVELDEPITIEEGVEYLIGYEFLQGRSNYPMAIDYLLEQDVECDYFYCYEPDYGFWDTCDGYGALLVQAVVKGGQFIDDDLALKNLSPNKFGPKDGELSYKVQIKNMGNKYPQSYKLKVAIDGEEKAELDTPIAVNSSFQSLSSTVSLEGVEEGTHTLTVSVADINGEVPTEYTSDDEVEASFVVYEGEMPDRQKHLIEEFTSIYCQYCPLGAHVLETMMENNPDKYILVACHTIGMGSDTLALYQDDYLTVEYFVEDYYVGYPCATFDRAQLYSTILGLEGDVCCGIGYYSSDAPVVATAFDAAIDDAFDGIPAFVTVDIDSEYNSDTRELKITVKGEGSEMAKELLDGNRLTIYLTEDGIEGRQSSYNETTGRTSTVDYTHDNVLRAIPTTYEWGDDIEWTSNSAYENTVTTTLPAKWDDSQIYITAFISGSMAYLQGNYWYLNDISEGMVNNANRVKATDVPAGISAVTVNTDDVTRTYYTTDGRQLSAPVKGVNIVKSSDGTVKKIYVK